MSFSLAVEGCLIEVLCNHSCGGSRGHGGYVGYIYMGSSTDQGFVLGLGSKGATDHVLQLNKVAVKLASCSNE